MRVLGIEGGGTKTEWHLGEWGDGVLLRQLDGGQLPAANLKLSSDRYLSRPLRRAPGRGRTGSASILAGCATETDRARLLRLACARWPHAALAIGSDRDSAMATVFGQDDGIVVIAGTGAAVHGRLGGRRSSARAAGGNCSATAAAATIWRCRACASC